MTLSQTTQHPGEEVDQHNIGVLTPQEWAMEGGWGGVLSRICQAPAPTNHSAHPHPSNDHTHLQAISTLIRTAMYAHTSPTFIVQSCSYELHCLPLLQRIFPSYVPSVNPV